MKQKIGLALVGVLIALISSVSVFFGMKYLDHSKLGLEQACSEVATECSKKRIEQPNSPLVFHELDKVVLSVKDQRKRSHAVLIELVVASQLPDQVEQIDGVMAVVKNTILHQLGDLSYEQLLESHSTQSIQVLSEQAVKHAVHGQSYEAAVNSVLLTKYIVQ